MQDPFTLPDTLPTETYEILLFHLHFSFFRIYNGSASSRSLARSTLNNKKENEHVWKCL